MTGMNPFVALRVCQASAMKLIGYESAPWSRLLRRLTDAPTLGDEAETEIDYVLKEIERLYREQHLPSCLRDVPENELGLLRMASCYSLVSRQPGVSQEADTSSLRLACYKGSREHVICHGGLVERVAASLPPEEYDLRKRRYMIHPKRGYGFFVQEDLTDPKNPRYIIEPIRRRILMPHQVPALFKDRNPCFWRNMSLVPPVEQTPPASLVRKSA